MTKEKTKEEKTQDSSLNPETIQKRLDDVEDVFDMAKAEINELSSENEKLKKLLK